LYPGVDLSQVILQAGDILAFRVVELGADWTPSLSIMQQKTISAHIPAQTSVQFENEQEGIQQSSLLETRLIKGPSFDKVQKEWKQKELARKQGQSSSSSSNSASTLSSSTSASSSSASSTSSPVAQPSVSSTNSSALRFVPAQVQLGALTRTPASSRSTRYSLVSNIVRALAIKKAAYENNNTENQSSTTAPLLTTHNEAQETQMANNFSQIEEALKKKKQQLTAVAAANTVSHDMNTNE
jgi:hypothetical protein